MKAATETLDAVIVQRPSCKQNLCLDKGYVHIELDCGACSSYAFINYTG